MTKCFVEVENIEIDVGITKRRGNNKKSKENKHKRAFGNAGGIKCRGAYRKLV